MQSLVYGLKFITRRNYSVPSLTALTRTDLNPLKEGIALLMCAPTSDIIECLKLVEFGAMLWSRCRGIGEALGVC